MRRQGKGIAALALLALTAGDARAEQPWQILVDCAATYSSRIEYMRALDQAPPGHLSYLQAQSDFFLAGALRLAPLREVDCEDQQGLALGLTYCLGHRMLMTEMEELTLDKLTKLVEQSGGQGHLPTCMEDAACSACARLLAPKGSE